MAFSSIDPKEMHQLGYGVQNAGKGLADCAGRLRAILNEVETTHPGVAAIDRVAQWLTAQAPDIYRRRDLAYEAGNVDVDVFGNPVAGAVLPSGMTRINESRMIPAEVRTEAEQAAPLFEAAARGDAGAAEKLAAYKGRMSDPQFATALMERLGPQALATLPLVMGARVRKQLDAGRDSTQALRQRNRDVLSMLSTALAAATDPAKNAHVNRRFIEELKKQGRKEIPAPDMGGLANPGYWSLGQILASAPKAAYSEWFMSTIGQDMIRWDREYMKERRNRVWTLPRDTDLYDLPAPIDTRPFQGSSEIGTADPIAALMSLAGTSRERAQALIGNRDLLTYLMRDRRPQWAMGDRGESLGEAMEAAMKGADADSKRLAVMATHIVSDIVRPHLSMSDGNNDIELKDPSKLDELSGIRDNMGRILGEHSDDIVSTFYKNHQRRADDQLVAIVDGQPVARFTRADLDFVMLDVAADEKGYQAMLLGQIAHMRGKIDEALATGNKGMLGNVIANDSKVLGHLVEAHRQALVARGKEADAADEALRKLVQEGIGLVPIPFAQQVGKVGLKAADSIYENFVRGGYAKAGDWLVRQSGHAGGKTAKAFSEAASNKIAVEEMMKQMIESSAVAHGAYRRNDLKESFVIGDPPKVKPPHQMNIDEYDDFAHWIVENTTVPTRYADAQQGVGTGIDDFVTNMRAQSKENEKK
ncbi:hypothetical protein EDD27_4869 [Nonomuraea polychroma]|uniref:Uncharacterized protein n=1 Tax=Nonomuraea polychroma TaxID=46176 RepID=A0A438M972_9ACTN|nr:DUF6571 family protein [Nonomuraea polychroma]RVX42248.1 hypothetical protein EDD27_4869 [Nonomuraea polychroma]